MRHRGLVASRLLLLSTNGGCAGRYLGQEPTVQQSAQLLVLNSKQLEQFRLSGRFETSKLDSILLLLTCWVTPDLGLQQRQ